MVQTRTPAATQGRFVRGSFSVWWVRVIAIYLASRAVSTAMILVLASFQGDNAWTSAHPGYFEFASIWDGHWYNIIAVSGYPSELPLTADGHVAENAWAFMPVYPGLVRGIMFVTGWDWAPAAVAVSASFGLAAALVFFKLMRRFLDESQALFAVVLFCVAPVSAIMQLAYAESMYVFLLTLALYLLVNRRYGWLFPVVFVMALTRPSGLAFALAVGLHVIHRWWTRREDPFGLAERVASISLAVFSGVMGLAWLLIAWAVTGSLTAYTDTELAWRMPYIGYVELVPFTAWFQSGVWWLGSPLGILAVVGLIIAFAALLLSPAARRLGPDIRIWSLSYGLYLLAVFFPQSSVFRLLLPMFPLLGAIALPRAWWYRTGLVVLCLLGQWGWLLLCWGVDGADWTPP